MLFKNYQKENLLMIAHITMLYFLKEFIIIAIIIAIINKEFIIINI